MCMACSLQLSVDSGYGELAIAIDTRRLQGACTAMIHGAGRRGMGIIEWYGARGHVQEQNLKLAYPGIADMYKYARLMHYMQSSICRIEDGIRVMDNSSTIPICHR